MSRSGCEEVRRAQAYDFPAFSLTLELEAHLGAAAPGGGERVQRVGVHLHVGSGTAEAVVGGDLQELVPELDTFMEAEESYELIAELGVVAHVQRVKDREDPVEVLGFKAALEVG